jgi:hypothetical protein
MQSGSNSQPSRKRPQPGDKRYGRSRLTNGTDLLPSTDGRSTWARIMRDTIGAMMAHLGGEDYATEPQRMLSRRAGALEAELVHLEDGFARCRSEGRAPEMADLDLYSRMSSAQRRLLEAIGLGRVARDVTPHPLTYAKEFAARKAAAEEPAP